MRKKEMLSEQDIPYEMLAQFGLTQEMIDDLPSPIMARLLAQEPTPALPLTIVNDDGETVRSHSRIILGKNETGEIELTFMPDAEEDEAEGYDEAHLQAMKDGEVVVTDIPGRGKCFAQYDASTGQVVSVPYAIVNQNISVMVAQMNLDWGYMEQLNNGKPVCYSNNKGMVTLGVDLMDDTCIRISKGDVACWKEEANIYQLPRYSFGLYGCWVNDEENHLSYIKDDDYTPDMENELKRKGAQQAAAASARQLKM